MAKLSFTKLGLKPNNETITITFNEQDIEVKQYLPIDDKLVLIANVLELSHDANNFSNPIKVNVYTVLEIIEKYTNINFTEKQKENPTKLYDLFNGSGLMKMILDAIPQDELDELYKGVNDTIKNVYKYRNSILGVLESATQNYSEASMDVDELQQKIQDPESLEFLKDVLDKMG